MIHVEMRQQNAAQLTGLEALMQIGQTGIEQDALATGVDQRAGGVTR